MTVRLAMWGRRMLHRLLWVALTCAVLGSITNAAGMVPAQAAPEPTPTSSGSASPGFNNPGSPGPPQAPTTPIPSPNPSGGSSQDDPPKPGTGLLGELDTKEISKVPISRYEITADTGGMLDWDKKLLNFLTNGVFSFVKLVIGLMAWLLGWAFEFGPAKQLLEPARNVANAYKVGVVDRLELPAFVLTLAGLWCGLMILRGRNARGWGELGLSVLISAIAATTLLYPVDLLMGEDGMMGKTRDTALALASITDSNGASRSQEPEKVTAPLKRTILDNFVAKPHQMLQFGTVIDENPKVPDACKRAYVDGLTKDPPERQLGDLNPFQNPLDPAAAERKSDGPGWFMGKYKECKDLSDYHKTPSWDRLFGAVLLLFAALLATVLILIMVGVLLIAICGLAFYAMFGHVVAVIAILPGGARGLLWRWIGGLVKIGLVICAVAVFIPLMTKFLDAMLASTDGQKMIVRFAIMDLVVAAGLVYHRKLLRFSTRAGHRIARRMELARIGGSRGTGSYGGMYGGAYGGYGAYGMAGQGWLGAGDPDAVSPVSASGTYHGVRAEIDRLTAPAVAAKNAWMGDPEKNAAARRNQRELGASDFKQKMYGSRGGRVLWRTAKATKVTANATKATAEGTGKVASIGARSSKVAMAWTAGAPVTWPRAAQEGSPQRQRAAQLREHLANVVNLPTDAAYATGMVGKAKAEKVASYATEYANNTRRGFAWAARQATGGARPSRSWESAEPSEDSGAGPSAAQARWREHLDNRRRARAQHRGGQAPPPNEGRGSGDLP
ncbi:type IV secretion system protein [Actinomadura sp. 6N118]|uniref:type IV secretion system protein n=1 Tax=Actinomadura sp. 6N118 TaxID=3375151 RepID=UPI0037B39AE5